MTTKSYYKRLMIYEKEEELAFDSFVCDERNRTGRWAVTLEFDLTMTYFVKSNASVRLLF